MWQSLNPAIFLIYEFIQMPAPDTFGKQNRREIMFASHKHSKTSKTQEIFVGGIFSR